MNRMIYIFLWLVLAVLGGCRQQEQVSVSGSWEGGDGEIVRLVDLWGKNPEAVLDSAVVSNGAYRLDLPLAQRGTRAVLHLGKLFTCPVYLDEEPLEINVVVGANDSLKKLDVRGGREQQVLGKSQELLALRGLAMAFGADAVRPDSLLESFVDSTLDCEASAYFLYDLVSSRYSLAVVERNYGRLAPEVKASPAGQALKEQIDFLKPIQPGGIAPDIQLADTSGQTIALYSLRGNYVLLDFWASWCGPCREEIPNLKEIYAAYHDKGLEIYSVSLDDKREAWTKAIRELELPWIHVSSLQGWQCPAAQRYKVTGIPKMYLLNPEGEIVAVDLRGEALKETIASLLK